MRNVLKIMGLLIGITNLLFAISFAKTFGGSNYDFALSIQQTTDGGYIVAGYTNSFGAGNYDFLVIKTQDGNMASDCPWYDCNPTVTSPSVSTFSPSLTVTSPGLTVTSPSISISSPTISTTTLCSTLGEYEVPPREKGKEEMELKLTFDLQKIEPNPAKEFTRIYYSIAKPCHVKIYVYDKKGAIVKKIVDEYKPQGIYREFWGICDENNNLLPGGVYFIKFEAGKYKETKKILILK